MEYQILSLALTLIEKLCERVDTRATANKEYVKRLLEARKALSELRAHF